MGRAWQAIWSMLVDIWNFDFDVTTSTFQNRYRSIQRSIRWELILLPVLALAAYLLDRPVLHLLYGVGVGVTLIYQNWCVGIMYGLAVINLQFAEVMMACLRQALVAAKVPTDELVNKAEELKAKFAKIVATSDGNLKQAIATFLDLVVDVLKIPPQTAGAILGGLDQILVNIEEKVKEVPAGISHQAFERIGPVVYKVMTIEWWIIAVSTVFWLLPWWRNPTAAGLLLVGGILILLLLPEHKTKELFTHANLWVGGVALVGLGLAYLGVSIFPRPEIIAACLALPVVVILPQYLGPRMVASIVMLSLGIWGLAMPEHWTRLHIMGANANHTTPNYYRVVRVGGMPKFQPNTRPSALDAFVGKVGLTEPIEIEFVRDTTSHMLDFNTKLKGNDEAAVKDADGTLYFKVRQIDPDMDLPTGAAFWVPFRDDFVQKISPPGTPVKASNFDPNNHTRIDERNTLAFFEFAEDQFGRDFQSITWLGYEPVVEIYVDPLGVDFEIGNGFESALPGSFHTDYSGVDLVCDISQAEAPVIAANDGEIDGLTLNTYLSVTIRHADGVWTHYGRLSKIAATLPAGRLGSGQAVAKGDTIGYIGRGQAFDPYRGRAYLYFAVIRQQSAGRKNPVDPLPILGRAEYPSIPWDMTPTDYTNSDL